MNMIWLMRTAGFEKYVIYVVNGLVFSFAFITIRTIVLGYYMYMFYLDIAAHPEFCQVTPPVPMAVQRTPALHLRQTCCVLNPWTVGGRRSSKQNKDPNSTAASRHFRTRSRLSRPAPARWRLGC